MSLSKRFAMALNFWSGVNSHDFNKVCFVQFDEATEGEAREADEGRRREGQDLETEAGTRSHAAQAEREKAAMHGKNNLLLVI